MGLRYFEVGVERSNMGFRVQSDLGGNSGTTAELCNLGQVNTPV